MSDLIENELLRRGMAIVKKQVCAKCRHLLKGDECKVLRGLLVIKDDEFDGLEPETVGVKDPETFRCPGWKYRRRSDG